MHTRLIPNEPKSEPVSNETQSGSENISLGLQGILGRMKKLIQNQLDRQEFDIRKSKIFNRIANNHATRIYGI